jgi:hypothetical protein
MAQIEKVLTTLPGGKKFVAVDLTDLTLDGGKATVTVGSVNQIDTIIGTVPTPELTNGYVLAYGFSTVAEGLAPNQIQVEVQKQQLSTGNTWGAAETTDISDSVIRIAVVGN